MKFSEALDALGSGLVVQHESWSAGVRLWYDESDDVFRMGAGQSSHVWVPQSFDLLSWGWRVCAPAPLAEVE